MKYYYFELDKHVHRFLHATDIESGRHCYQKRENAIKWLKNLPNLLKEDFSVFNIQYYIKPTQYASNYYYKLHTENTVVSEHEHGVVFKADLIIHKYEEKNSKKTVVVDGVEYSREETNNVLTDTIRATNLSDFFDTEYHKIIYNNYPELIINVHESNLTFKDAND